MIWGPAVCWRVLKCSLWTKRIRCILGIKFWLPSQTKECGHTWSKFWVVRSILLQMCTTCRLLICHKTLPANNMCTVFGRASPFPELHFGCPGMKTTYKVICRQAHKYAILNLKCMWWGSKLWQTFQKIAYLTTLPKLESIPENCLLNYSLSLTFTIQKAD